MQAIGERDGSINLKAEGPGCPRILSGSAQRLRVASAKGNGYSGKAFSKQD